MTDKQTTRSILDALAHSYGRGSYLFFEELLVSAGQVEQRLDAWAIDLSPEAFYMSISFEVKASRSDLRNELKNYPTKRLQALQFANQFYYVTPPNLFVDIAEVPGECGWMIVDNGTITIMKSAPFSTNPPPTWGFVASLLKRMRK